MYEKRDANYRNLMLIGAGLVVMVIVTMAVARGMMGFFGGHTEHPGARPSAFTVPEALPPEPRLQVDEAADLAAVHRAEDSVLSTYGWVSRDSGLVRVPIQRAMALLVTQGLPARKEGSGKESPQ
jgi:hypothetical protein